MLFVSIETYFSHGGVQAFMRRVREVLTLYSNKTDELAVHISLYDWNEDLSKHNIDVKNTVFWCAKGHRLTFICKTFLCAWHHRVAIIGHINQGPLGLILKKLRILDKYAVILHGNEVWKRLPLIKRISLKCADILIATTKYTLETVSKRNNLLAKRGVVIPLCVEKGRLKRDLRFRLVGNFKILSVGRMVVSEPGKGFDKLIDAISKLLTRGYDLHLNLVGDGDDRIKLEEKVHKMGLFNNVTFWGFLSKEKLNAAYRDCDIFVLPSRQEGFGITFLEAMQWARPCIGGKHGGIPEVIVDGETGFLVEYNRIDKLADSIAFLYRNSGIARKMGLKGQDLVFGKFSFDTFKAKFIENVINPLKHNSYRETKHGN